MLEIKKDSYCTFKDAISHEAFEFINNSGAIYFYLLYTFNLINI